MPDQRSQRAPSDVRLNVTLKGWVHGDHLTEDDFKQTVANYVYQTLKDRIKPQSEDAIVVTVNNDAL